MEHSVTITAYFNVLNMDSYPNSDSKFVAYIFIHSSKEAANSMKISVPTLLLPPLKRVPYMILCSSSTELTGRKHKTRTVEVFTAHWKTACWKVLDTFRSISEQYLGGQKKTIRDSIGAGVQVHWVFIMSSAD